jgi:hypothetical protein
MKFTFKKHISTGRYRSFETTEFWDIKLDKIVVGSLSSEKSIGERKFNIHFMVWKKDIMEDGNPNCGWKWILLKYKPSSFQEAKDFLVKFSDDIQKQFNLYLNN